MKKQKSKKTSNFRQTLKVFFGRGIIVKISLVILILFVVTALFAPILEPYNPLALNYTNKLAGPSLKHLLGTDALGRDVLSRLISGAQISLLSSLLSGLLAAVVGIFIGLIAGYYGGVINTIIMRIVDMILSIPSLVFAMVIAFLLGGGVKSIVIAIGFCMIPTYIRMVNGLVTTLRENDYVVAARIIGQNDMKILIKHLFPNCFPSLIVLFTMNLGSSIMIEAALSYLGIGINPPQATWGSMVSEGYNYLLINPWLCFIPGVLVILVVISFNIVGDGLRDALDPRLRGKL